MKKGKGFPHPMSQAEAVTGWVYVFVHMFAMSYILLGLNRSLFPAMGFVLSGTWLNLLYYIIGFVFLVCFLFHYLRETFADMCSNLGAAVMAVLVGFVAYIFLSGLVNFLLSFFLQDLTNPNSATINSVTKLNPNKMLVIGVLLAPVVEETLFRGVVFGTIRRRSAVTAYIVSSVFFSVYHLWSYLAADFSPIYLLYLLQYLPAGLVLGWCYEYSGTLFAPIFLHMAINYVSLSVQIG